MGVPEKTIQEDPCQLAALRDWEDQNLVKLANHYNNEVEPPVVVGYQLLERVKGKSLDAWPLVEESLDFLNEELSVKRSGVSQEGKSSGDEMVQETYECQECGEWIYSGQTSGFRVDRFVPVIRAAIGHRLENHH